MSQPSLTPAAFAEWRVVTKTEFDSMINVRPRQGNRTRSVDDPEIRRRIMAIVDRLVRP